jgi:hypothetical protein
MTIWCILQWFSVFDPACVGAPVRASAMGSQSVLDTGCGGVIHSLKFLLPRVRGVENSWSLKRIGWLYVRVETPVLTEDAMHGYN